MDNFIYFSEQVSESVDVKTENVDFEEVNLEENNEYISKNLYEKDPLNLGENSLSNDIKVENIDQENICPICDQCFSSASELLIHKNNHFNDVKNVLQCQICHKIFRNEKELIDHKESHFTTIFDIQCEYCNTIITRENYRRHLRNTHKMKDHLIGKPTRKSEHVCDVCQKSFRSLRILKEHVSASHLGKKMYTCKFCSVEFVNRSSIIKHMYIHTKEKTHICHICDKSFLYKSYLRDHLNSHTGKKKFECNVCYKKFIHRSTLRIHKLIHDPNSVKVCEKCGQNYFSRKNSDVNNCNKCSEPYHCEVCNKDIMHRGSFLRHIKIHTGTKEYTCQICNQGFVQKVAYNLHMSKHKKNGEELGTIEKVNRIKSKMEASEQNSGGKGINEEKERFNFFCQICDQQFETEDEINNHMEIHSDLQADDQLNPDQLFLIENYSYSNSKYSCTHCSKKYSKQEKLLEHLSKHQKEDSIKKYQENIVKYRQGKNVTMRFQCEICPFRFKERENLEKHMLSHLGENNSIENSKTEQLIKEIHIENPFKCNSCNRTFINNLSLEKHLETHKNLISSRPNENSDNIIENLKFESESTFSCTVENCRKKFINQLSHETHMKVHHHGDRLPSKKRRLMKKNDFRKVKFVKVECPGNLLDSDLNRTVRELSPKLPENGQKSLNQRSRRKNKILGDSVYFKPPVLNDKKSAKSSSKNHGGLSPSVVEVDSSSKSLSSSHPDLDKNLVCSDSKCENVSSSILVLVQNVSPNSPDSDKHLVCGDLKSEKVSSSSPVLIHTNPPYSDKNLVCGDSKVSSNAPVLVHNVSPNPPDSDKNLVCGDSKGEKVSSSPPYLVQNVSPNPPVLFQIVSPNPHDTNKNLVCGDSKSENVSPSHPVLIQNVFLNVSGTQTGLKVKNFTSKPPDPVVDQKLLKNVASSAPGLNGGKLSSKNLVLVQTGTQQKVSNSATKVVQSALQLSPNSPSSQSVEKVSSNNPVSQNVLQPGTNVSSKQFLVCRTADNKIILLSTNVPHIAQKNQESLGTQKSKENPILSTKTTQVQNSNQKLEKPKEPKNQKQKSRTSVKTSLHEKIWRKNEVLGSNDSQNLPAKAKKSKNLAKKGQTQKKAKKPNLGTKVLQPNTNLPVVQIVPTIAVPKVPNPTLPQSPINNPILTRNPVLTVKNSGSNQILLGSPLGKSFVAPKVVQIGKPSEKLPSKFQSNQEPKNRTVKDNFRIVRKRIGSNIEPDELMDGLVEVTESESVQNDTESVNSGSNKEFDIVEFAKTLNASDFITRRSSRVKK